MRVALTIAGSDSSGGAGIQADLKTFHQFGVYGMSVITAITAQNTCGVKSWEAVNNKLVREQIDAVAEDIPPQSFKTGMLGNRAIVIEVAEAIKRHKLPNFVLDPVMVATSGDVLVENDAIAAIRETLLPLATLVTPNIDEAAILTGDRVVDEDTMGTAAVKLVREYGVRAALVKGGHLKGGQETLDVLFDGSELHRIHKPRHDTTSTHGTGCTLSAAIVAGMAMGTSLQDSVERAVDYVNGAIASAPGLGGGNGPLNHFSTIKR